MEIEDNIFTFLPVVIRQFITDISGSKNFETNRVFGENFGPDDITRFSMFRNHIFNVYDAPQRATTYY